jgi:hypothetical protein
MHRAQFVEEAELGWRAAGAIERENEGPIWMRRYIISMRQMDQLQDYESARAAFGRPKGQMM